MRKQTEPFISHNNRSYNWLIHRIHDDKLQQALSQYATGVLVDIGCGEKPYAELVKGLTVRHIGVDHPGTIHDKSKIDVLATAYETTLPDATADTVLCTSVLEHLERPDQALREMYRILKPGGHLILSVPFLWHLHEAPRDFYRFTTFGLSFLLQDSGFQVVEIQPLAGFIVTFAQELSYFLKNRGRPILRYPIHITQQFIQNVAYQLYLRGKDGPHEFTWAYLAVGRKPLPAPTI
jgi:SAM-dependent methyltransferase